jgi:hypothetical protein
MLAKHGLTIVAIQHGFQAKVNDSIEEFCAGIRHSDSDN